MGQVKIQESIIGDKGKVAILSYLGDDDPVEKLDKAVSEYVGNIEYKEFIDINMDNPWVRVIIYGINEMKQDNFNAKQHKLKS